MADIHATQPAGEAASLSPLAAVSTTTATSTATVVSDTPPQRPAAARRVTPRLPRRWSAVILALMLFAALNMLAARAEPYFARVDSYDGQFTPAQALADYYENPRSDIIYMGSSRAQDGFDPAVVDPALRAKGINTRSLNLAISGSGADAAYLLLKNIIQDEKKPKVIVYGLAEFEVHSTFPGSSRLDYYSTLLRPDNVDLYAGPGLGAHLSFQAQEYAEATLPLLRDRDLIRNALSMQFNPEDPSHQNYAPGPHHWHPITNGHYSIPDTHRSTAAELQTFIKGTKPGLQSWNPGGHTQECLEALFDLAHARGIQVVLVDIPASDILLGLWGPGILQQHLALVRQIAQRHHVPLLELYTNPNGMIPQTSFTATSHLKQGGAAILSRYVADYLATACASVLSGASDATCTAPPSSDSSQLT